MYCSDKWFKNLWISAYDEVFKLNNGERNSIEAGELLFPTISGREEKLTFECSKFNACWPDFVRRIEKLSNVSDTEGSISC